MTTLVTGGTGFLGRHVVERLVDRGDVVRVLARSYDPELAAAGVEFIEGSVLDDTALDEALDGVRRVVHLAGLVERDASRAHRMYTLHVDGTRALLKRLVGSDVEKVVVASTSGTVGVGEHSDFMAYDDSPFVEETVRRWPYYLSKIYAERVCDEYHRLHSVPVVTMRPALFLGPGDDRESSIGDVVLFLRRRIPSLLGGGLAFVDVRDAADAFVAALDSAPAGAKYLLGGANMSIAEFFGELEEISGVPAPTLVLPGKTAEFGARLLGSALKLVGGTPPVDAESMQMAACFWYVDSSRARQELGFEPRPPTETLRDTVRWIQRHHPDFASTRSAPKSEFVRPETVAWADRRTER